VFSKGLPRLETDRLISFSGGDMTGAIIVGVLLVVVAVVAALRRERRVRLREEPLGNPHPTRSEPVVRAESRHYDTPAAADLDQRSGRHDT
jgi:hypothetical protein